MKLQGTWPQGSKAAAKTIVKCEEEITMKPYREMSKEELASLKEQLEKVYKEYQGKNLKLNMARGKPSPEQLDLSLPMMDILNSKSDYTSVDGDVRNYGVLTGIKEARELMGQMMDAPADNIIMYGSSSLTLMYDTVSRSYSHGVMGSTPWCKLDKVKFLCPVPGYDRHFAITESFGIELINIPLHDDGPDMDMVEQYVNNDETVKGIWCVPLYSNPSGQSYSDEVVKRFAHLKPAAKDFRIFWDNAYCVHHLDPDHPDHVLDILSECEKAGNPDMVYKFGSTAKVTFPGAGISAIAASKANLEDMKKQMNVQMISHDKINQLRHVRFFKDLDGIKAHMRKQAAILRPRFEAVDEILTRELGGLEIGTWTKPHGGYFVSFDSLDGCAKAIVAKCKEAGVVMTGAGATYPYGKDPHDSNIRIAPSFPSLDELKMAAEIFCVCVKLVSIDKLLEA